MTFVIWGRSRLKGQDFFQHKFKRGEVAIASRITKPVESERRLIAPTFHGGVLPQHQPRRYFDRQALKKLVESVKNYDYA